MSGRGGSLSRIRDVVWACPSLVDRGVAPQTFIAHAASNAGVPQPTAQFGTCRFPTWDSDPAVPFPRQCSATLGCAPQAGEASHVTALGAAEQRCEQLQAALEALEGQQREALAGLAALGYPADEAAAGLDTAVAAVRCQRQQWELGALEQQEAAARPGWVAGIAWRPASALGNIRGIVGTIWSCPTAAVEMPLPFGQPGSVELRAHHLP
jgi:hypothetical protein